MTQKEYTEGVLSTSTHSTREKALSCSLFGLLGEALEYMEKTDPEERIKEMGDFCYYLHLIAYHIGHEQFIKLPDIHNIFWLPEFIPYVAQLQEFMKKDYRDNDFSIGDKYKEKIHYLLDVLYTIVLNECKINGMKYEDVLIYNNKKLASRKERNVITGQGDNR